MKKFQFSLDKMRSYKERLLDEEKTILLRLRQERDAIERHIDALERAFAAVSEQMATAQKKGTTILELQGFHMQLSSTRRQLTELRAELEQAQIKVDRQMRAVLLASQEVSKLDKLHDKQFEVYQSDAKKAEDLRIEELVSTGVVRRSVV